MALLEKLEPGSVYLVKISAANRVGDGPFSQMVELAPKRGSSHRSKNPRHSSPDTAGTVEEAVASCLDFRIQCFLNSTEGLSHAAGSLPAFSDGLYHIDQRSMTGIIVGVCIALACIVMCALILINKGRPRCWLCPHQLWTASSITPTFLFNPFFCAENPPVTKFWRWELLKVRALLGLWPTNASRRPLRP